MKRLIVLATASLLALPFLPAAPALAAPQVPTEMMGSHYHDPVEKAAESYSRGMKEKRKAEGESDPEKRTKGLLKAKEHLLKSVGYQAGYDALIALGEVNLALQAPQPARDACARALSFKPGDNEAQSCFEKASQAVLAAKAAPAQPADPKQQNR